MEVAGIGAVEASDLADADAMSPIPPLVSAPTGQPQLPTATGRTPTIVLLIIVGFLVGPGGVSVFT